MRNPFFGVICNRGNFTREMKKPFGFAKELLRYSWGELSGVEKESVEEMLSKVRGLDELAGELRDKERVGSELRVVRSFDVEKALVRLKKRQRGRKRLFLPWVAASVVVMVGISAFLLLNRETDVVNLSMGEKIGPGKAIVTLEMASGLKYRLDTLSSIVRNNRINVTFDNDGGVLKIREQDSTDHLLKEVGRNTINVPYGGTYTVELCDGTKVYLNSGTKLEFPSRFDGDMRSVSLKGEAYFEVSKNKEKPFLVQVDDMSVKVYGTAFNVNTYNKIETVLVTGSVSMNQGGKEVLLKPNQKGVFDQVSGKITVEDVDVLAYVSWKNGDFIFRNESLNSIMDKLSRWYGLEVLYQDAGLQEVRLSGNLKRYKDVRELFVSFEKISDARFKVQGNKVIVSSK